MSEWEDCARCYGLGTIKRGWPQKGDETCPDCKGSGRIKLEAPPRKKD